ncbi:hypothetical protein BSKO_05631 [Bryopsis sp. KO-2023]|nr:hypothetical protein BSKO_05631 [Bryopsis sp. KO-2023]
MSGSRDSPASVVDSSKPSLMVQKAAWRWAGRSDFDPGAFERRQSRRLRDWSPEHEGLIPRRVRAGWDGANDRFASPNRRNDLRSMDDSSRAPLPQEKTFPRRPRASVPVQNGLAGSSPQSASTSCPSPNTDWEEKDPMIDLTIDDDGFKEESFQDGPPGVVFGDQQWPPASPPHRENSMTRRSPRRRSCTPEPMAGNQTPIMLAPPPQGFVYDVVQKPNNSGMLITCRPHGGVDERSTPKPKPRPSPVPSNPRAPPSPVNSRAPPSPVNLRPPPSPVAKAQSPLRNYQRASTSARNEKIRPTQQRTRTEEEEEDDDDDDEEDDFDPFGQDASKVGLRARLYSKLDNAAAQNSSPVFDRGTPPPSPRSSPKQDRRSEMLAFRSIAPPSRSSPAHVTPDSSIPMSPKKKSPKWISLRSLSPRPRGSPSPRMDIDSIRTPRNNRRHTADAQQERLETPEPEHSLSPPPSPERTPRSKSKSKSKSEVGRFRAAGGTKEERNDFHKTILAKVREWGEENELPAYGVFKHRNGEALELFKAELQKAFPMCYEKKIADDIIGSKVSCLRRQLGISIRGKRGQARKRKSDGDTQPNSAPKRLTKTPKKT